MKQYEVREGKQHDQGRFSPVIGIPAKKEEPGYFEILIYYVIASFVREAWKVTEFRK